MNIGKRLHQIREQRNISQARIARALGVSVGTIQGYEHERTRITADRLEQMAHALQCELIDLLAPPGSPPPRYCRARPEHVNDLRPRDPRPKRSNKKGRRP